MDDDTDWVGEQGTNKVSGSHGENNHGWGRSSARELVVALVTGNDWYRAGSLSATQQEH